MSQPWPPLHPPHYRQPPLLAIPAQLHSRLMGLPEAELGASVTTVPHPNGSLGRSMLVWGSVYTKGSSSNDTGAVSDGPAHTGRQAQTCDSAGARTARLVRRRPIT